MEVKDEEEEIPKTAPKKEKKESWRVNVDWLVRKRGVFVKKELTEIYLEELSQMKEKTRIVPI